MRQNTFHRFHDLVCAALGLILNLFLIFVIQKQTRKSFKPYARLITISCIYDVVYSIVEILCQHQVEVKNGVFIVVASGIEVYFPWLAHNLLLSTVQLSLLVLAVTIIPAQFRYRYLLLKESSPPNVQLLLSLLGSFAAASSLGFLSYICRRKCQSRNRLHYESMLGPEWRNKDGHTNLVTAIDMQDGITAFYYAWGSVIITASYSIAIYYGHLALKAISPLTEITQNSARSLELKRQFNRNLILQAGCAFICSIIPTGFVALSAQLYLDVSGLSVWIMSLLAWNSPLNAILALTIIQPYRQYVKELLGWKKLTKENTAGISTVETASNVYN